jgi:hypothetical protein
MTMSISRGVAAALWAIFVLLGVGCRYQDHEGAAADLRSRILAANLSPVCGGVENCLNPMVFAEDRGITVTTYAGGKQNIATVPAKALRDYLLALPMAAWPHGAVVTLSRADLVIDSKLVSQNFTDAEKICRSLGLDLQIRPGG